MWIIRRHPLTGQTIRQDLNALRAAPEVAVSALSPGRAQSEDVPAEEMLDVEAGGPAAWRPASSNL